MSQWKREVEEGKRYSFGKNWRHFLNHLDEGQINRAREDIERMLATKTLAGKTFLDVGSGSGLHSLAARKLGARVHSFDYDSESVACTQYLRDQYFPGDDQWTVEEGSILDEEYLHQLGTYDVVYSWGVLHHTGEMWRALDLIDTVVAPKGILYIAIYNDQGWKSRIWQHIKGSYNRHFLFRWFWGGLFGILFPLAFFAKDLLRLRNPLRRYRDYSRGMTVFYDLWDWLGGYPFEVATPEKIHQFYRDRGYHLEREETVGGKLGCNEFVFAKG